MPKKFNLHSVAPRLALARDQYVARRRILSDIELELQRLVAHRDLQLQRAFVKGNGRYIVTRQKKLNLAKTRLDRIRNEIVKG